VLTAFAVGYAVCLSAASEAGKVAGRSIDDLGVLVLLIPALFIFAGVLAFAVRRSNATVEIARARVPFQSRGQVEVESRLPNLAPEMDATE
jgi:hypothetical protein